MHSGCASSQFTLNGNNTKPNLMCIEIQFPVVHVVAMPKYIARAKMKCAESTGLGPNRTRTEPDSDRTGPNRTRTGPDRTGPDRTGPDFTPISPFLSGGLVPDYVRTWTVPEQASQALLLLQTYCFRNPSSLLRSVVALEVCSHSPSLS